MDPGEIDPRWLALLIFLQSIPIPLILGRAVLSFLPPGRIGGHQLGQLPVTLATSYLVGLAAGYALWWLEDALGLGFATRFVTAPLVALVLASLRIASAPHRFAPGPLPLGEGASGGHLAIRWACAATIVARLVALARPTPEDGAWIWSLSFSSAATLLAAVLIIDYALARSESRPRERSLAWVLLAALAWRAPAGPLWSWLPVAVLMTAGMASFLVDWWRCADMRSGALVALSCCALVMILPGLWWIGALGIAVLLLGTPAGGRRVVVSATIVSFVLLVAPLLTNRALSGHDDPFLGPWDPTLDLALTRILTAIGAPLAVLALGLLLAWARPPGRAA